MSINHSIKKFLLLGIVPLTLSATTFPETSQFWNVKEDFELVSIDKALEFSEDLKMDSIELKTRLITGLKAASMAGSAIRQVVIEDNGEVEVTIKADGTPVTTGDIASGKAIEKIVKEYFPLDGFISEEEHYTGEELKATFTWVIDPLDGTEAFTKKRIDWGIHIGLLKNQKPVMGINFYPTYDIVFFAVKDGGAYRATAKTVTQLIKSKATPPLKTLRKPTDNLMKSVHEYLCQAKICSGEYEDLGSVGLRLMYIVEGHPGVLIIDPKRCFERSGIYDFLSSDVILTEAGMDSYTDCDGNALQYFDIKLHNGILASPNFDISREIIEIYHKALRSQK